MMDPGLQKATKIQGLSVKEVILLLKVLLGLGISLEYGTFFAHWNCLHDPNHYTYLF